MSRLAQIDVEYTRRQELAHSLTHALGVAACLAVVPWLTVAAATQREAWRLVGGLTFGLSALLVFTASTLYHATTDPVTKERLRDFDHCAIFLLIAGTYTPFTIGVMHGTWRWVLFGLVWGAAFLGIAGTLTLGMRFKDRSTLFYLAMGWAGIIALGPLINALTQAQVLWLLAGGIAYTIGVPFYLWKRTPYAHSVWHVMVLVGASCHFQAVMAVISAPVGAVTGTEVR